MAPYLLLLFFIVWMALAHMQPQLPLSAHGRSWKWNASVFLLMLMIGFRLEVGADWEGYLFHLEDMKGEPFYEFLRTKDLAYGILNWFGANVLGGIYFVNLACSVFFCWGLAAFCQHQPRPWLALLLALSYLVMVVAMGYSRQGVAIGLVMLAIVRLAGGSFWRFFFWITLAALFHKTAVILLPLALFSALRSRIYAIVGVAVSAVILFSVILLDEIDYLTANYLEAELNSSGASIRIAMNAIPAAFFLIFRKRFSFDTRTYKFWLWMSWSALFFIPLLIVSPSSTAIDRVALYWIPLQLVIYTRLPDVLGVPGRRNQLWVVCIVAYSSAVMLGWLTFAAFASYWLPYRFYPWEVLWS